MNEEVLDYLERLYKRYNRKLRSPRCTISETERLSYIIPELKKILEHFERF